MATQSNQWAQLVRMLEQRFARQKIALAETELQLDGAKKAYADAEAEAEKVKKASK